MGATLLRSALAEAGLGDRVEVDSCGTSWESEGAPIDERTALALTRAGYEVPEHIARAVQVSELAQWDLVLAMTASHAETMRRKAEQTCTDGDGPRILLWRAFDPTAPANAREDALGVADPWYEGQRAFDRTVRQLSRALPSLVLFVRNRIAELDRTIQIETAPPKLKLGSA